MKEVLNQILLHISGVIKSRALYPIGHPAIKQSISKSFALFTKVLERRKRLYLGIVEEVLTFEDVPFYDPTPAMEEFQKRLFKMEVEKIIFSEGMTELELTNFIQILCSEEALEKGALYIEEEFERRKVLHIELGAVAPEAQEVYSDAVNYMGGALKELRMGRIPKGDQAISVMRDMTKVVLKDRDALVGLTMIKNYDDYLFTHSVNVGILSLSLAHAVGLKDPDLSAVGVGGLLHDVGKTRTPKEIILKPGKLTEDEWVVMKQHTLHSFDITGQMNSVPELSAYCSLEHHVNYNRKGYPVLKGGRAPHEESAIVQMADTYDAITTLRPYQPQTGPKEALEIMNRLAGAILDPSLYQKFVEMIGIFPVGQLVRLDTNELAVVFETKPEKPLEPKVRIVTDPLGRLIDPPKEIDLSDGRNAGPSRRNIVSTADPALKGIEIPRYLQ